MNKVLIIGIGGNARVGKGTFEQILVDLLGQENCYTCAFATQLREDIKDFCVSYFGISPYDKEPTRKKIIRPIMIESARIKRKLSHGEYFVDCLKETLKWDKFFFCATHNSVEHKKYKYIIINDYRFAEYYSPDANTGDETGFIKEFGGKTVHIKQFEYLHNKNIIYVPPFSDEEMNNDPLIEKYSDFQIKWPKCGTSDFEDLKVQLIDYVRPVYEEIIKL